MQNHNFTSLLPPARVSTQRQCNSTNKTRTTAPAHGPPSCPAHGQSPPVPFDTPSVQRNLPLEQLHQNRAVAKDAADSETRQSLLPRCREAIRHTESLAGDAAGYESRNSSGLADTFELAIGAGPSESILNGGARS